MKEKRILRLTLYRRHFNHIAIGAKKDEFRDRTPYWIARLEDRTFDEVHFHNGYGAGAPFMRVEWLGMTAYSTFFAIHLGRVLELDWNPLPCRSLAGDNT